jgi:hypothetical protein
VLKESKTKSIVHVKERPNDRLREAFLKEVAARHVLMMARQPPKQLSNRRETTPKRRHNQSE